MHPISPRTVELFHVFAVVLLTVTQVAVQSIDVEARWPVAPSVSSVTLGDGVE